MKGTDARSCYKGADTRSCYDINPNYMLLRASPSVRSRLIRGHAVYTRRQDDDHLISESPGGSVSARGSVGHLGYHPVGHREQRGLWAQAGHRSPSCPTGTPAQPGVHARRRGRTGACEESLFMLGLYTGGSESLGALVASQRLVPAS